MELKARDLHFLDPMRLLSSEGEQSLYSVVVVYLVSLDCIVQMQYPSFQH
jgi:hypothetical protein